MPSGTSEDLNFGSLAICGCSTSFIIFATGIACLVVSLVEVFKDRDGFEIDCGQGGKPPLLEWVFGTGIAFLIMTCSFAIVSWGKGGNCAKVILAVSNLFIFIWAIVGAVSLGKHGKDCETINPTLWRMGYAAVVISFIVCCCGGFVGYQTTEITTVEAHVVTEGP